MFSSLKSLMTKSDDLNVKENRQDISIAILLLEIADVDGHFDENEKEMILETLRYRFEVNEEQAKQLLAEAVELRQSSNDLWEFTNYLNENLKEDERFEILEEIWRVILADGKIDAHETSLVRRFTDLLHLSHDDMIEAKLNIIDEMGGDDR